MDNTNANNLGAFMAILEQKKIQETNNVAIANFNKYNAVLDFTKEANKRLNDEYINEVNRVTSKDVFKAKEDIQQEVAKTAMNEGITGGASKGRLVRTLAVKGSEAIGGINSKAYNTVAKATQQLESDTIALETQRLNAYNALQEKLIMGSTAALQIQSARIAGYQQGLQKDEALAELNKYKI